MAISVVSDSCSAIVIPAGMGVSYSEVGNKAMALAYDFLVIGTVKGGTTTLHHLLFDHPMLAMPREKEAALFLHDVTEQEIAHHVRRVTRGSADKVSGKVTPLYMCLPGVAPRISRHMPDVKLIALLREPISRARSHWMMRTRLGADDRPFASVIREQLDDPTRWRRSGREEDAYVASGEYARILTEYRDYFPAEHMLALSTDELKADPQGTVDRVCAFIGVPAHRPAELGVEFNVAERTGRRARMERALWRALPYSLVTRKLSLSTTQRVGTFLDRHGISRPGVALDATLDRDLHGRLRDRYLADAEQMPGPFTSVDVWHSLA